MRRLLILTISLLLLMVSCEKEENKPESVELNPRILPNSALKDFKDTELYLDTISYFNVKVNYLPQNEIALPQVEDGYLKYELAYSLTDLGGLNETEMEHEIINDTTIILKSKNPIERHNNYLLEVFAMWQKKIGENGIWEDCGTYYNERITQTINTSLHPDSLNPGLLPNPALRDFSSSELHTDIVNPYTVKVNYIPLREIEVQRIKAGFLRYKLAYTLTGDEGEVDMEYEILNDSTLLFSSAKPLTFNKNYVFKVSADWQKKVEQDGVWQDCEEQYKEEISQNVITDIPLDELVITESDFIFQYPLDRQFNYLEEEYNKGYFRLTSDKQKQLMLNAYKIKLLNVNTAESNTLELIYNENLDVFEYELQPSFLENESVYEISLLTETEELVYSYYFKTSKYNSFSEKWDMLKTCFEGKWRDNVSNDGYPYSEAAPSVQKINVTIYEETLDYYESNKNKYSSSLMPLIQMETHVPEEWKATAEWQIYSWNSLSYERQYNDCKKYGFPPLRAIYFSAADWWAIKLSDESITGNIEYPDMPSSGIMVWEVQNFMKYDAWSASNYANEVNEYERDHYQEIAAGDYQDMDRLYLDFALGDDVYPLVDVYYVLPGLNIETTKISSFQL